MQEGLRKAIVGFVTTLVKQPQKIRQLEHLSTGEALIEIASQVEGITLDTSRVMQVDGWANSLTNLKLLNRALETYYRDFLKQLPDQVDLLRIAKYQQPDQILKLFKNMMAVISQAPNKLYFIEKIMSLESECQNHLASLVQSALDNKSRNTPQSLIEEKRSLLHKLDELTEQIATVRLQNTELKEAKQRLAKTIQEQSQRIEYLQEETAQLRVSTFDAKVELMSNLEKESTNTLVENLKEKLISVSIENEKMISRYRQEIQLMENAANKTSELEKLNEDYADTIKELTNKIGSLTKQKEDLNCQLEEKQRIIDNLHETERMLSEKIKQMEYEKVNLKMENERVAMRSNELKQAMTKMNSSNAQAQTASKPRGSLLSEICPQIQTDTYKSKCQQLQQQILIHTRRNKQLEKDLSKARIKADKADKLETEKRKLQEILLDYTNSRGEQNQLLVTALYQLRIRYKNLAKKFEQRENIQTAQLKTQQSKS